MTQRGTRHSICRVFLSCAPSLNSSPSNPSQQPLGSWGFHSEGRLRREGSILPKLQDACWEAGGGQGEKRTPRDLMGLMCTLLFVGTMLGWKKFTTAVCSFESPVPLQFNQVLTFEFLTNVWEITFQNLIIQDSFNMNRNNYFARMISMPKNNYRFFPYFYFQINVKYLP